MGVCVGGSDGGPGRCFEWETPVGLAVNLVFLMWWVAVVVFFIRVLRFGFRERSDEDDLIALPVHGSPDRLLLVVMLVGAGVLLLENLTT